MIKDIQGKELKIGQNVCDIFNDEVAKVINILSDRIKIQYFGDENYLNGQIEICKGEEVEII